jgi:hypothetical protein
MNIVCVNTPRKFIMASERDKNVVANPPIARGAYGTKKQVSMGTNITRAIE